MNNNYLFGKKIIQDLNLVVDGHPITVKRTIFERLFTRPWRPFKKTRTEIPLIPSSEIFCSDEFIMCHPQMVEKLKRSCEQ